MHQDGAIAMAHQDEHEIDCKCNLVNALATDYAISFSQDCDIAKLTGAERITALEKMLTILVATIVKEGHESILMQSLSNEVVARVKNTRGTVH